jgi:hypothetical protein
MNLSFSLLWLTEKRCGLFSSYLSFGRAKEESIKSSHIKVGPLTPMFASIQVLRENFCF